MDSPEEYEVLIAPLRAFIENEYQPLHRDHVAAIPAGRSEQLATLAEELEGAADRLESLWSATLFTRLPDLPAAVLINEAAGAMAMLSDIWGDLARAHRSDA